MTERGLHVIKLELVKLMLTKPASTSRYICFGSVSLDQDVGSHQNQHDLLQFLTLVTRCYTANPPTANDQIVQIN